MSNLVEIGLMVLEIKIFFLNSSMYFRYFVIMSPLKSLNFQFRLAKNEIVSFGSVFIQVIDVSMY